MSRPEKPIDWPLVERLLKANCDGTEIAPHFDMHPNTFYRRVEEKYEVSFSEYSQSIKAIGDTNLKLHQYEKAMGITKKGDNAILIFLGKTRLKQVEANISVQVEAKTLEQASAVMDQITQAQSEKKLAASQ